MPPGARSQATNHQADILRVRGEDTRSVVWTTPGRCEYLRLTGGQHWQWSLTTFHFSSVSPGCHELHSMILTTDAGIAG